MTPASRHDSNPATSACADAVVPPPEEPRASARPTASRMSSISGCGVPPGPGGATIVPSRRPAGKNRAGGRAGPSDEEGPGGVPVTEIVDPSASSPTIRIDVVDG